jgi:hypothetical protein
MRAFALLVVVALAGVAVATEREKTNEMSWVYSVDLAAVAAATPSASGLK